MHLPEGSNRVDRQCWFSKTTAAENYLSKIWKCHFSKWMCVQKKQSWFTTVGSKDIQTRFNTLVGLRTLIGWIVLRLSYNCWPHTTSVNNWLMTHKISMSEKLIFLNEYNNNIQKIWFNTQMKNSSFRLVGNRKSIACQLYLAVVILQRAYRFHSFRFSFSIKS